jgi:uncharacterized protein
MSRFSFKNIIPSADALKENKSLRFLHRYIDDPNLFHMNRKSVSLAFFWGVLIGLLPPIPIQTALAALAAIVTRCNLPMSITIVWVGNPLTYPFIMYASYSIGRCILQMEPIATLEFSWEWISNHFELIWKPYLIGALIGATSVAAITYLATNYFWRLNVKRKWQARQQSRPSNYN